MVNGADVAVGEITVEAAVVMGGALAGRGWGHLGYRHALQLDLGGDCPGCTPSVKTIALRS